MYVINIAQIKDFIYYYKSSIADSQKKEADYQKFGKKNKVDIGELKNGLVNRRLSDHMFKGLKYNVQKLKIIICPIVMNVNSEHGVKKKLPESAVPLMIPAILHRDGTLERQSQYIKPWIARKYLRPTKIDRYAVGHVDKLDEYYNKDDFRFCTKWEEYWRYTESLVEVVTGKSIEEFQLTDYTKVEDAYIIKDDLMLGTTLHLHKFYETMLESKDLSVGALAKNIFSIEEINHNRTLSPKQQYVRSAQHFGQMAIQYPLSESQRETMNHYTGSKEGEIFAVNGPPGTGKTTFLHTAIAHEYVKAALEQKEPPVIVAISNNNQAVTNIIDSFGDVFTGDNVLGHRWIPNTDSFGSYFVSSSNTTAVEKYQCIHAGPRSITGFFEDLQAKDYLSLAEREFLDRAGEYMGKSSHLKLDDVISDLHKLIKQKVQMIDNVINTVIECQDSINAIKGQYDVDIMTVFEEKTDEKEQYEILYNQWNNVLIEFEKWIKRQTFVKRLLMRWDLLKGLFIRDFDRLIDEQPILFDNVERNFKSIESYILEQKTKYKRLKRKLKSEVANIKKHIEEINTYEKELIQLGEKYGAKNCGKEKVADSINDALDITLRYEAFRLATHYYEGKWLQEAKDINHNDVENRLSQLRRIAKITPCFVSTFYMVPKLMEIPSNNHSYKPDYLYEGIDILIVDEAGQASPEVSLPLFALAKQAIMVGDTYQIEPVWGVEEITDLPNINRYLNYIGSDIFKEIGYASSSGNLMKIAKRRSIYEKYGEGGLYLTEHRRCIPEVIQYCNELAYNGKLKPMRANDLESYPFNHMSHIHTSGNSEVVNGSRKNDMEANAIVNWIVSNTNLLLSYYNSSNDSSYKSIENIVAVITPFKSQKNKVKALLKKYEGLEKITVGTVHSLQGAERHVVIFSTVYTHRDPKNYFFDRGVNMLNVAVSRAKDCFMVVGDNALFKNQNGGTAPSKILAKYLEYSNEVGVNG